MGYPQIKVDDNSLDNGSWRHTVGDLIVQTDETGKTKTISVAFIIEGDTSAELDTRWQSTYADFKIINPRVRAWFDDAETTPVEDWIVGGGEILESGTTVTMLPEESQTGRKLHCLFVAVATVQADISRTFGGSALGTDAIPGLKTEINIVKTYFDSRRFSITASGMFGPTFDEDANGPYTITSITNNGGKARFTLSGSPDLPDFADGMRITVTGSNYAGVHIVTSIDDVNDRIETLTTFETVVGTPTTLLLGTTTSAETNYEAAKSDILVNLLETGTDGNPAATAPYMQLTGENVGFPSERRDYVEFTLTSTPQPFKTSVVDSGADNVERGLSYVVHYRQPDLWDESWDTNIPVEAIISGKFAITETARTEATLFSWWTQMKQAILAEVATERGGSLGSSFVTMAEEVNLDHTTNDVDFRLSCILDYNGTMDYSKSTTFSDRKMRSIIEDTDGYDHVQESAAPPRRMATVRVTWTGEMGAEPDAPVAPPAGGGFRYLFDNAVVVRREDLRSPDGRLMALVEKEYTYIRIRPRTGGSSVTPIGPQLLLPNNPGFSTGGGSVGGTLII